MNSQQGLTQKQSFALSRVSGQQRQMLLRSYNMQRNQSRFSRVPRRRPNLGFYRNNGFRRFNRFPRRNFGNNNLMNVSRIKNPRGTLNNKVSIPRSYGFNIANPESSTYNIRRTAIIGELKLTKDKSYWAKSINVHPGNMPWVSSIARNFDKFRFVNFRVRLLPNVGTGCNGVSFLGFTYENHHVIALDFNEAQSYDKFCASPVWSDSGWISIPNNILSDKWYDTSFIIKDGSANPISGDSFHDFTPGRVVVGYSGVTGVSNDEIISRVEVDYNLILSRPTLASNYVGSNPTVPKPSPGFNSISCEDVLDDLVDSLSNVSIVDDDSSHHYIPKELLDAI